MLTHLTIRNLAITESLSIEFKSGMSAITGETGAGKSILMDGLGYVLGNRADSGLVRQGSERAEIIAEFDVKNIASARQWLESQDLSEGSECILRRTITREGRSRATINGQPVPLQQIKQLGNLLLDLHSQHEHHSLMDPDTQRRLLDEFAGHLPLVAQVTEAYQAWRRLNKKVSEASKSSSEHESRMQLLRYQVEELDRLALAEGELEELEAEQTLLANGEAVLKALGAITDMCQADEGGVLNQLHLGTHLLNKVPSPAVTPFADQLNNVLIQLDECLHDIEHFVDRFELDDLRLTQVNDRLSSAFELARKHQTQSSSLIALHQSLKDELASMEQSLGSLEEDTLALAATLKAYEDLCQQLTTKRQQAARHFETLVTEQMQQLALSGARLEVEIRPLTTDRFAAYGSEDIIYMVQTNPGQPAGPLAKIASGGELSRISLAIQVICAENSEIPTLVFDEVDVGVSGATSELVGRMLRHLGNKGQVLCVTHQPQVSSLAHQHMKVSKHHENNHTKTGIAWLSPAERTQELARLLGGVEITGQTLAHAEEMLTMGQTAH